MVLGIINSKFIRIFDEYLNRVKSLLVDIDMLRFILWGFVSGFM